jgi:hypothetical protein
VRGTRGINLLIPPKGGKWRGDCPLVSRDSHCMESTSRAAAFGGIGRADGSADGLQQAPRRTVSGQNEDLTANRETGN